MKMSKAAWITAFHYSWERTVEKYTDVYEEILEKRSKL
jgi:glycosyltransferase involved in cell wall biosynthesis